MLWGMSGTSLDIPIVVMLDIEAVAMEYGWHFPRNAILNSSK